MNEKEANEILLKYNLKTDVKSIRERVEKDAYWALARSLSINNPMQFSKTSIEKIFDDIRAADLSLLCELAEKGERYEKAVKNHREELEPHRHIDVCAPYAIRELDEIITESEGEPK